MDSSHWLSLTTMAGEHRESKKAQLALALAQGQSVSDWARTNQVRTKEQLDERRRTGSRGQAS